MAPKKKNSEKPSTVYRSADTGRFVSKEYAAENPKTTTKEKVVREKGTDHTGPRKSN